MSTSSKPMPSSPSLLIQFIVLCLILHQVRGEDHSGWEEDDYVNEALLRFTARREMTNKNNREAFDKKMANGGKSGTGRSAAKFRKVPEDFRFMHLYEILVDSPVFLRDTDEVSKKRKRVEKSIPPDGFFPNGADAINNSIIGGDDTLIVYVERFMLLIVTNDFIHSPIIDDIDPEDSISNYEDGSERRVESKVGTTSAIGKKPPNEKKLSNISKMFLYNRIVL